jgi:hypothetical protein
VRFSNELPDRVGLRQPEVLRELPNHRKFGLGHAHVEEPFPVDHPLTCKALVFILVKDPDRLRATMAVSRRRLLSWIIRYGWVPIPLGAAALTISFFTSAAEWSLPTVRWAAVLGRAGLILVAIPFSQCAVGRMKVWLDDSFDLKEPAFALPKNRIPQRLVGIVENIAYPWIFFDLEDKGDAATAVTAWIVLKTVASWKGWEPDDRDEDKHKGRRRMYAFLLCNAVQLLSGIAVAWLMTAVR